jgi:hypothetical protein
MGSRSTVHHDAAYGGSHFTHALVLSQKGDAAGVAREVEAAKRYWADADRDLPELKEMADLRTAARSGGGKGR